MSLKLHLKNPHPRDVRVEFYDPTHTYKIDGSSDNIVSSTGVISKYFEKFDSDKIISNIVKSDKWLNDKSYKYYKIPGNEIKKIWEESGKNASELGTKMHEKIEYFYNDNDIEIYDNETELDYFLNFYNDNKDLDIYRTEFVIFAEDLLIGGSIDAMFKNDDGTYDLYDWKRSKEIKKEGFFNKKAKGRLNHLSDCNYSKYSLQLNLYRKILEDYYGYKIRNMNIVVFHPNNKNYIIHPVSRMESEIEIIFEDRRKELEMM